MMYTTVNLTTWFNTAKCYMAVNAVKSEKSTHINLFASVSKETYTTGNFPKNAAEVKTLLQLLYITSSSLKNSTQ